MKKLLPLILIIAMLMAALPAQAIKSCPHCAYLVNRDTIECPKCLKLLKWPFVPERSRKATVVVRTGTDAFIRHPHAQNRAWLYDRNAGGDLSGEIGVWGGPGTLRYLIKFDIPQTFALAGVSLRDFKLSRAFLKINTAKNGQQADIPVIVYPLDRPFEEGRDRFRTRERDHDGCDWVHSAPLMPWHREGGDYSTATSSTGIIKGQGSSSIIDVTEIISMRLESFARTGIWEDPGMIIMSNPHKNIESGFVTIYSLESRADRHRVRSPELFIE